MSGEAVFYNALAVIGSVLLLFGFYRINTGRWNNKSFWYEMDNAVGAFLIIAYQIYYHAFVSVAVNLIWAAVAVVGLSVFFRRVHTHVQRRKKRRA